MLASAHDDRTLSIYALSTRDGRQPGRELFTRLNREDPVHWDRYAGTWLVSSRAEAVRACVGKQFSARRLSGPEAGATDRIGDAIARQALFLDEPAHSTWRPILRHVLAPTRVRTMAPWMARRLDELIDAGNKDDFDVVADLARPFPFDVMVRLLGLPRADLAMIRAWSDSYTRIITGFAPRPAAGELARVADFLDYAQDLIRHSRHRDTDDGLGALVGAADSIGTLNDTDIAANLLMLIAAAHQTTTGFLAGAVLESLSPSFGPFDVDATGDATVEELLMRVSPSRFVGRVVTEDAELSGRRLRAGQSVLVLLAAINWRELTTRTPGTIGVAFGLGRHHCPGAQLAHLEGDLVLRRLFGGVNPPRLREDSVRWSDNVNLPCPVRLRIRVGD